MSPQHDLELEEVAFPKNLLFCWTSMIKACNMSRRSWCQTNNIINLVRTNAALGCLKLIVIDCDGDGVDKISGPHPWPKSWTVFELSTNQGDPIRFFFFFWVEWRPNQLKKGFQPKIWTGRQFRNKSHP